MGYKGIGFVAVISGAMGILVAFVSLLRTLPSAGQPVPPSLDGGLVLVALAFVAICLLAGMAAATLRDQADEIAALRRELLASRTAL